MFAFTLRQIEVFLAACEAGSFRRAADRLSITQAGVSNHVRSLEQQLGYPLFERRRGARISVSPRGEVFRENAIAFAADGRTLGKRDSERSTQVIRMFVGAHLLEDFIRPALPAFSKAHPDIILEFLPDSARGMISKGIKEGRIDGVLLTGKDAEELPDSVLLSQIQYAVYGNDASAQTMETRGLSAVPFIIWASGEAGRTKMFSTLRRLGVKQAIIAGSVQHHDVAIRMACQDIGAVLALSSFVAKHDVDRKLKKLVSVDTWERRLFLSPKMPPDTAKTLEGFLRAAIEGEY